MIADLTEYLTGIAIGIRYRINFSVEDQLGRILDQILYSKDSFFNPGVFPRALTTNVNEKRLINENTGDQLIINNSNIILEIGFGDSFEPSDMSDIIEAFHGQLVDGIMKTYRITEINRVGLIHRYLYKKEDLAKTFIDKTIGGTLEGINDINLTFSKKIPEQEALVQKDVNDYYNVIFNVIKKADRQELFMSIDYQKYFDPFLQSSSTLEFPQFVEKAIAFNKGNYQSWLTKNYGVLQ